jgi:ATPase subunit of ABC transporter with duplicated ATPase domains
MHRLIGVHLYRVQEELNSLFDRLALREPEEAEAQARSILTGLGFTQEQQEGPIGQLSGGGATCWLCAFKRMAQPEVRGRDFWGARSATS